MCALGCGAERGAAGHSSELLLAQQLAHCVCLQCAAAANLADGVFNHPHPPIPRDSHPQKAKFTDSLPFMVVSRMALKMVSLVKTAQQLS